MSFAGGNYLYQAGGSLVDNSNDFNRLATTLGQNVTKIQQNTKKIRDISTKLKAVSDNRKLGEEQLQLIHYTKQLVTETNSKVKELNNLVSATSSDSERKQRRIQKDKLVEKFTSTVNEFKEEQFRATQTQKECVQRARQESMLRTTATPAASDTNLIDIRASPSEESFDPLAGQRQQQQQQQQIVADEEANLAMIRQREQDILQLEGDIVDLNQIYKDLGMMVHEQGEVIDSIEAHVDSAAIHVEEGNVHLRDAETYQRKARKKKFILLGVFLAAAAVLTIIIYFSVKN